MALSTVLVALTLAVAAGQAAGAGFVPKSGRAVNGGGVLAAAGYQVRGRVGAAEAGGAAPSGGGYQVNGGGLWALESAAARPRQLFLPLLLRDHCQPWASEREPNHSAAQANGPLCPQNTLAGAHDGAAGTGDVFLVNLRAGQQLRAELVTANPAGVQLLLYFQTGSGLAFRAQAAALPFRFTHTAAEGGAYYLYIYSDPTAGNTARYTLETAVTGP